MSLTYGERLVIISLAFEPRQQNMRACWNRQTGTFEGRVFHDVWVQVPLLAPKKRALVNQVLFSTGAVISGG